MSTHPSMTGPVVARRMTDRQQEAAARRRIGFGDPGRTVTTPRVRRPTVAHRAGRLLIVVGQRLAGPDHGAATGGSHRWT